MQAYMKATLCLINAKDVADPIVQAGVKLMHNPDLYMDMPNTEKVICAAENRLKQLTKQQTHAG